MNRIQESIARMKLQIEAGLKAGVVTEDAIKRLNLACKMTVEDIVAFQNTKTNAQSLGVLSLDEAQTVYEVLGESATHFEAQPLEAKVIIIKLMSELMSSNLPST